MEIAPLVHRLAQLARLDHPRVEASSIRSFVIGRGVRGRRTRAVFLPDQLERVVAVHPETTMAHEIARISAVEVEHAPTMACVLRNARLLHGCVYAGRSRLVLADTRPKLIARSAEHEFDLGTLASTYTGNRYFGHWLTDDSTLSLVAREFGPPVVNLRRRWLHQDGWERVMRTDARAVETARFRELIVIQDFGQNEHRRARFEMLRQRVAAYAPRSSAPGVFLRHGKSGEPRGWRDSERTEARLARRGFAILEPEALTVDELLAVLNAAPIVVGLESSAVAPAILTLPRAGALLCIQSPTRFNNVFKDYTDALGLHYGFVVGTPTEGGFSVDPDEIERTLDLFESAPERDQVPGRAIAQQASNQLAADASQPNRAASAARTSSRSRDVASAE